MQASFPAGALSMTRPRTFGVHRHHKGGGHQKEQEVRPHFCWGGVARPADVAAAVVSCALGVEGGKDWGRHYQT